MASTSFDEHLREVERIRGIAIYYNNECDAMLLVDRGKKKKERDAGIILLLGLNLTMLCLAAWWAWKMMTALWTLAEMTFKLADLAALR